MSEKKRVPNPDGRKGGKKHRDLITLILDKISKKGKKTATEYKIDLPNGTKRYADAVGIDENGNVEEIHQIGKQNQDGTPVKRERDAIADIEKATGKKVTFHAYNMIGITVIFAILTATMIYSHVTYGTPLAIFGL